MTGVIIPYSPLFFNLGYVFLTNLSFQLLAGIWSLGVVANTTKKHHQTV